MRKFVYIGKQTTLKAAAMSGIAGLTAHALERALKKRDVKLNGARVQSAREIVNSGDEIAVYFCPQKPEAVFEDSNILVLNKPAGIESTDGDASFLVLAREFYGELFAVHRLDALTKGLIVFAKNEQSLQELLHAFKHRTIDKYYTAEVMGSFSHEGRQTAYLLKNAELAKVAVSHKPMEGYRKIVTEFRVQTRGERTTTLEVKLVTGATHQIRAHLMLLGNPILGDDLYGNRAFNKEMGARSLRLTAHKIRFHFPKESPLGYLNDVEV